MDKIYSRYRVKIPKMKIYKTKNIKKVYFTVILLGIAIFTSSYILKSIDPIFEGLCKSKALGLATDITNRKATDVLEKYDYKKVVNIQKSEDGKNNVLSTDVVLLNEIISDLAVEIQKELEKNSKQYIEMPIGALTGNQYFAGFGPKIKIKVIPAGDVITDIRTEFKAAGINQTIYRIYVNIECNVNILTSYKTINNKINNQVMLIETVIVGDVPETYLNLENLD